MEATEREHDTPPLDGRQDRLPAPETAPVIGQPAAVITPADGPADLADLLFDDALKIQGSLQHEQHLNGGAVSAPSSSSNSRTWTNGVEAGPNGTRVHDEDADDDADDDDPMETVPTPYLNGSRGTSPGRSTSRPVSPLRASARSSRPVSPTRSARASRANSPVVMVGGTRLSTALSTIESRARARGEVVAPMVEAPVLEERSRSRESSRARGEREYQNRDFQRDQALERDVREPRERGRSANHPVLYARRADGVFVKIVCPDCGKCRFPNTLGFINHARMAHDLDLLSLDEAANVCGQPVPDAEVPLDHPCRRIVLRATPSLPSSAAAIRPRASTPMSESAASSPAASPMPFATTAPVAVPLMRMERVLHPKGRGRNSVYVKYRLSSATCPLDKKRSGEQVLGSEDIFDVDIHRDTDYANRAAADPAAIIFPARAVTPVPRSRAQSPNAPRPAPAARPPAPCANAPPAPPSARRTRQFTRPGSALDALLAQVVAEFPIVVAADDAAAHLPTRWVADWCRDSRCTPAPPPRAPRAAASATGPICPRCGGTHGGARGECPHPVTIIRCAIPPVTGPPPPAPPHLPEIEDLDVWRVPVPLYDAAFARFVASAIRPLRLPTMTWHEHDPHLDEMAERSTPGEGRLWIVPAHLCPAVATGEEFAWLRTHVDDEGVGGGGQVVRAGAAGAGAGAGRRWVPGGDGGGGSWRG
ncbi:hypothetical protein AMAG_20071 [Allomyces macrogynus ATCC 38327]|uniref:Uncharacterized protein n=1 Tax=Allomyces macrogynus (strain ATCC 38327) TaxID=578462 RepID=A0A0L0T6R2_ALLM3|nr:hypothetical protein AMAG_20071 [Allomyces macrogynus ATCC 38327]|eukprot:KNE70264.1 hypothetical protein AMAG_20071 [Allomyces macrogynus ATCC 38327]